MSFFNDLLGKSSAKAATALGQRNATQLRSSYGQADTYAKQGYDAQQGFYKPYADAGNAGQTAYANTLGLNGQDARNRQFQEGYVNDPALAYRTQGTQTAMSNLLRKYNAGPSGVNSGAAMYGVGRLNMDRFDQDWGDYRSRLMQLGQQGLGVAGAQAGAAGSYYGGMADRSIGLGNALVSNDTNATMAANNARMAGINNLLKGAGALGGAVFGAFAPGAGGATIAGNMANFFGGSGGGGGGGGNSTWFNPDTNQAWDSSSMPQGGYAPDPRRPWS